MGGINETIQLAAALDRRGITIQLGPHQQLAVRTGRDTHPMPIRPVLHGTRQWTWTYAGTTGAHPSHDHEGTAAAIETFLRGIPVLAGTELLHRMDHMGQTRQHEEDELLERARTRRSRNDRKGSRTNGS